MCSSIANCGHHGAPGTIPSSLGNAKELATLALAFNNLTGQLPESLGSLPLLKSLRLAGNALSGSIPDSFGLSKTLAELSVNGNNFTGLPSVWYNPDQGVSGALAYVDVGSNALSVRSLSYMSQLASKSCVTLPMRGLHHFTCILRYLV